MIIFRRIRRFIWAWQDSRRKRRLRAISEQAKAIAAVKMKHGKSRPLEVRQQQQMLNLLRGGH